MNLYSIAFIYSTVCHSERSEESPVVDKCFLQKTQKAPNRITEWWSVRRNGRSI